MKKIQKTLVAFLIFQLCLGGQAFSAEDINAIINGCSGKVSKHMEAPKPDRAGTSGNSCLSSRADPKDKFTFAGYDLSKCQAPYDLYKQSQKDISAKANAQCLEVQQRVPQTTDQTNSLEVMRGIYDLSANNMSNIYDQALITQNNLLMMGQQNIQVVKDYRSALPIDVNNKLSPAISQLDQQFTNKDFKKGQVSIPNISGISGRAKVVQEQLQTANFVAGKLKAIENLKLELKADQQRFANAGREVPPPGNGIPEAGPLADAPPAGSPGISGLLNPSTLMGLATIGASLAPLFMKKDEPALPPPEKPALQTSGLGGSAKPTNVAGFSQPVAPETKTEATTPGATPSSTDYDYATSDITDKSAPITNSGGVAAVTKASDGGSPSGGGGGDMIAKNGDKKEEPKPAASSTAEDLMGGLGGGGAGGLGYSSPNSDSDSPIKDLLPNLETPGLSPEEGSSLALDDGSQASRELASSEEMASNQAKNAESLFFRVRGSLDRCQKKGCVSSTAGNAAKNLPF